MSRAPYFDSPFLLGFDQLERVLDSISHSGNDGYPPYNVEKTSECGMRITLAVAGFDKESLEVTLQDGQLVIKGDKSEDADRVYLHRGIASRHFQRTFILAEGMEIAGAYFENGLLNIDCERPEPELVVRKIEISSGPRPSIESMLKTNGKLRRSSQS